MFVPLRCPLVAAMAAGYFACNRGYALRLTVRSPLRHQLLFVLALDGLYEVFALDAKIHRDRGRNEDG